MATPEQVRRASGDLVQGLIAQGCSPEPLLRALGRAWGIPPASRGLLAAASPARVDRELADELAQVPAVLVRDPGGGLVVLVTDARGAARVAEAPLPPHVVHLALRADIDRLAGTSPPPPRPRAAPATTAEGAPVATTSGEGPWAPLGTEDSVLLDGASLHKAAQITSVSTMAERIAESGAWGDLAKISIVEVVQILRTTGTDAVIELTLASGRTARVALSGGAIVFADDARRAGDEAFLELATERAGGFVVATGAAPPGHNVRQDTDALMRRAQQIAAEASSAHRAAPPAPRPPRHGATAILDLKATPAERVGKRVGDYEVLEDLGAEGSTFVLRARNVETDEEVALKILTEESVKDAVFLRRFKREVRTHAVLRHANILGMRDYGRIEGTYFLATEAMEHTLDGVLEPGPVPAALVIRLLHDVLRGLAFAHDRGVVHRDLTPEHVVLSPDGQAKIADFGLARYELDPNKSSTGAVVGTPRYMSPEQALGERVDLQSDLFTLGTVAWELLAGRPRFEGRVPAQVMMAICNDPLPSLFDAAPTVPRRLLEVVARLGARERAARYATAHDALGELAPLAFSVNLRHPDVLRELTEDAPKALRRLREDQASLEARRGIALRARGRAALDPQAALCAVRARALDPQDRDGRRLTEDMSAAGFVMEEGVVDPALTDLERRLDTGTDDEAELLRRLAKMARGTGDVRRAAGYLLRLDALSPADPQVKAQLTELFGDDPRAPFEWTVQRTTTPTAASGPHPPAPAAASASPTETGGPSWTPWIAFALFLGIAIALVVATLLRDG